MCITEELLGCARETELTTYVVFCAEKRRRKKEGVYGFSIFVLCEFAKTKNVTVLEKVNIGSKVSPSGYQEKLKKFVGFPAS